ncbi:NUDIX domain-containing protein [Streptomyces chartreusis]|uniref:NUDIX domain-containing protein n=1 Tax=Streptomyces chartreusis TaxID=1969 RepID=UPI00363561F2
MAYRPPTWPVSVKGVALDGHRRVVVLKNEREEWELPGGRLEPSDGTPELAVEREIATRDLGAILRFHARLCAVRKVPRCVHRTINALRRSGRSRTVPGSVMVPSIRTPNAPVPQVHPVCRRTPPGEGRAHAAEQPP